jgi:hypothetical protein
MRTATALLVAALFAAAAAQNAPARPRPQRTHPHRPHAPQQQHPAVRHGWRAPPDGDPGPAGAAARGAAGRGPASAAAAARTLLQTAAPAAPKSGGLLAAAKRAAPLPAGRAAPKLPPAAEKNIEAQLRERLLGDNYDRLSFPWAEHGPANVSLSLVFYRVLHVDLYGGEEEAQGGWPARGPRVEACGCWGRGGGGGSGCPMSKHHIG